MTTVSGFELGKFRGEVEARLTGHDKGIEELANGLAEVSVTCTDIKLMLAKQNGLWSLAKTGGAGAGGAGAIVAAMMAAFKFLG